MPSIADNERVWTRDYDWQNGGEEWSQLWGSSERQWSRVVRPRIGDLLPAPVVLEIAPGYGRWTEYLKDLCDRLIVVDLSDRCIDACRRRFARETDIEYHVNDGMSLEAVPDSSLDFAFSFDSLVHVEKDVMEAYISQLARKLKPDGVAFLHHSNYASYARLNGMLGRLSRRPDGVVSKALIKLRLFDPHTGWRATTVSAKKVAEIAEDAGMVLISQELINWGYGHRLLDCISVLTPAGSRRAKSTTITRNRRFMHEAREI